VPIPPIAANTIIIPWVLRFAYGEALPIHFMMLTVGIGEVISCFGLGMILLYSLEAYKRYVFSPSSFNNN